MRKYTERTDRRTDRMRTDIKRTRACCAKEDHCVRFKFQVTSLARNPRSTQFKMATSMDSSKTQQNSSLIDDLETSFLVCIFFSKYTLTALIFQMYSGADFGLSVISDKHLQHPDKIFRTFISIYCLPILLFHHLNTCSIR